MVRLETLSLKENEITSLKDLSNLPALKTLNVNTNKLENLDQLPSLPALEKLDVGANPIEKLGEIKKLRNMRNLRSVVFAGCPFADEKGDDLKKEVLIALDHLPIAFVNDDEILPEDR